MLALGGSAASRTNSSSHADRPNCQKCISLDTNHLRDLLVLEVESLEKRFQDQDGFGDRHRAPGTALRTNAERVMVFLLLRRQWRRETVRVEAMRMLPDAPAHVALNRQVSKHRAAPDLDGLVRAIAGSFSRNLLVGPGLAQHDRPDDVARGRDRPGD